MRKRQSGQSSYYTRRQTERDRVVNPSTMLTIEEFLQWFLAHDFFPGTTAEVKYEGRIYKLTLSIEEKE